MLRRHGENILPWVESASEWDVNPYMHTSRTMHTMSVPRSDQPDDQFEERLKAFMERNFPQIRMHGGAATILSADPETGEVEIQLSGACAGCGISPMTIRALETRLTSEFDAVTEVTAFAGEPGSQQSTSPAESGSEDSGSADDDGDNGGWLPF